MTATETVELRVSGFGGQGIILAGHIVGQAASLHDGMNATMVQAYGPEARGSACSSQVIISGGAIHYPFVEAPQILVCMSQEAYDKFLPGLRHGGTLLIDETLVDPEVLRDGIDMFAIPATDMAEKLGLKIIANIVMLGFFTAVTGIVSEEGMRQAVAASVPEKALELNLEGFDAGYRYGLERTGRSGEASREPGVTAGAGTT